MPASGRPSQSHTSSPALSRKPLEERERFFFSLNRPFQRVFAFQKMIKKTLSKKKFFFLKSHVFHLFWLSDLLSFLAEFSRVRRQFSIKKNGQKNENTKKNTTFFNIFKISVVLDHISKSKSLILKGF